MSGTRRFIAGAVCPRCGALDRLLMDMDGAQRMRECVACGYRDELDPAVPSPDEPSTRVNSPRPGESVLPHEEEVQVLRLDELAAGKPPRSTSE